ncbi:MAG: YceI family protein [Gillisia sp.]
MANEKSIWKIDASHSNVTFKVKHMMISTVSGEFEKFEGTIKSEKENFEDAEFNFSLDVDSVNTKNKDRDNHLKSDDFFNAEKFPKLTFTSTSFDGEKLKGNLTIRDVTKPVTLNVEYNGRVEDPYGQTKAGFEITGDINRKEFNLTWNGMTEAGKIVVSDKVRMVVDAQFIKQ